MITSLSKRFHLVTQAEHEAFACLSGDYNPLHTDAQYARRLMFGGTVTHGVHIMLRALEGYAEMQSHRGRLVRLAARFFSAIPPAEAVTVEMQPERIDLSRSGFRESVLSVADLDNRLLQRIHVQWKIAEEPEDFAALPVTDPGTPCKRLSDTDIVSERGTFPIFLNATAATNLFPKLSASLPPLQFAALLGTTYVVGMRLPGYDSIFSSLDVCFGESKSSDRNDFLYETESYSPERRYCRINVSSPGMSGRIEAFVRPNPVTQPSFAEIRSLVAPRTFAGQCALVVGGGRGLGEVCAKLLAAGGAAITLTYWRSAEDAQRVAAELANAGVSAQALYFDAADENPSDLMELLGKGLRISDLYYFATPPIFRETKQFSYRLFAEFADVYIRAAARLFETLAGPSNDRALRGVWLPSSAALESQPEDMTGYIMAKLAMEYLATVWARNYPHIRVATPRLPRLITDQTVTLAPVFAEEPAPLLAELLKSFAKERHTS